MTSMHNRLLILLLLVSSLSASAQTFLVLEKMGTKKRFEFHPGQTVTVRLYGDKFYTPLVIKGFGDKSIVTESKSYPLQDIYMVKIPDRSPAIRGSGFTLMVAGVLLFAIDGLNQTVVQGSYYKFSPGVAMASGALIGAGAIMYFGFRTKVKLNKWWRLRFAFI